MPKYRVDIQGSAERDLGRLAPELFERVASRLSALAEDPRPAGTVKLVGLDAYRIRVGDHRVLYEIDDRARVVIVVRVRHRRDAYRRVHGAR